MNSNVQFIGRIATTLFRTSIYTFLLAAISSVCAAQDQQNQKKEEPATSASTNASATTVPATAAQEAPKPLTLKEAIRQKKVLTEDDLHPQFGRRSREAPDTREFNPICNPQCEQMVRDQLQTDDSSELEFRNKFALATQAIDDDSKWGYAVVAGVHAADDYCELERNRASYAYPGATEPYTTDKLRYEFIPKERELINKFKEAEGNLKVRIQNMRATDSFRATVMQSQWDAALGRACRGVSHL
jgi:hypothetical protein